MAMNNMESLADFMFEEMERLIRLQGPDVPGMPEPGKEGVRKKEEECR